jgi:hypothetical protein
LPGAARHEQPHAALAAREELDRRAAGVPVAGSSGLPGTGAMIAAKRETNTSFSLPDAARLSDSL